MDDGVPKPGSVLSLISNKNVKYVGTLFHIDMESTAPSLRLKNVRCYGTEGRGDPQDARPPSDEILPDVLFRGTDIIFLEVQSYYHPPPLQPAYSQPQVQYGSINQQGQADAQFAPNQSQYGNQEAPVWGSLPSEYSVTGSQYMAQGPTSHQQPPAVAAAPMVVVTPAAPQRPPPRQPQAAAPRPARTSQTGSQQPSTGGKATTPFETVQAAPQAARQAAHQAAGPPGFGAAPPGLPASQSVVAPAPGLIAPAPGLLAPAPGMVPPGVAQAVTHVPLLIPQAAPQVEIAGAGGAIPLANGPPHHQGRGGRGRGRGGRGRGPGRGPPPPQAPPIPQEDFNFEEGIQKFDKDQTKTEASAPIEEVDSGNLYNKDDFFDALSSDLTNKLNMGEQSTRPKFSEQRQIDMETFGGTGMARRGRGRGGRRGRGGGLNPYATGREHLEAPPQSGPPPPQGRTGGRGRGPGPNGRGPPRGRGRGRGRHSEDGQPGIVVQ